MEFIGTHSLPVMAAAAPDSPGFSPATGENPPSSWPERTAQPVAFYFRSWPFPYDPKMAEQAEKGFSAWQDRLSQYRAASLEHQHKPSGRDRAAETAAMIADRPPARTADEPRPGQPGSPMPDRLPQSRSAALVTAGMAEDRRD